MFAAATLILAVDLGKFRSVFCWYDVDTKHAQFRTVATNPDEFRDELLRHPVVTVVVEACSPAGWVHDLCEELKLPIRVASTHGQAWQWKNVKRKTDRDDALKLAKLVAVDELETAFIPPKSVRQWKSLIGLRKRLVSERVRGQNRIRGPYAAQVRDRLEKQLRRRARELGFEVVRVSAGPEPESSDSPLSA